MFFYLYKNSLINCDFSLRYEIAFSAIQKLKLFSLLKSKEGLKQATEIELPVLMRVFFKNSLIYCRFRLKLRAMRLLRKHFIAKRRFQQLPNLKIRSLLKSKEGLKTATKLALLFLMASFFQNSLIYCRFSFHCKTAFSATPEFDNSLVAEK